METGEQKLPPGMETEEGTRETKRRIHRLVIANRLDKLCERSNALRATPIIVFSAEEDAALKNCEQQLDNLRMDYRSANLQRSLSEIDAELDALEERLKNIGGAETPRPVEREEEKVTAQTITAGTPTAARNQEGHQLTILERMRLLTNKLKAIGYPLRFLPSTDTRKIEFQKLCDDFDALLNEVNDDAVAVLISPVELEEKIRGLEGRTKSFLQ